MSTLTLLQPHPERIDRAEPAAEARYIRVFNEIVRRDRGSKGDAQGRFKQQACRELSFIYHMGDYRSPYFNVASPEERQKKIIEDVFPEPWQPDDLVLEGLETYKGLLQTPSMRLLEAANEAVSKLESYLRSVEFESLDESGKLVYSPKDLIHNLEKLAKVVDGLSELKKQVEKERLQNDQTYGGYDLNEFNR